jgi:subtilisin family serine protease/subtilisin-like proprotein convertase family protein/mRNA-degrading endonuclease HigB of HigAB toxin-antitoxin module
MKFRAIGKNVRLRPVLERLELRQLLAADLPWNALSPFHSPSGMHPSGLQGEGEAALYYVAGKEIIPLEIHPTKIAIGLESSTSPESLLDGKLDWSRGVNGRLQVYESESSYDPSILEQLRSAGGVEYTTPVFVSGQSEMVLLDEIIVGLKPNQTIESLLSDKPQLEAVSLMFGTTDQYVLRVKDSLGVKTLQQANALLAEPEVAWVSPNFYQNWKKFYFPNDPLLGEQWHLNNTGQGGGLIDADSDVVEAWDINRGGSANLVIGVIDDGVQGTHQDIRPWVNTGEVAGDGIDNDGNGYVDDINGWNFVFNTNQSQPQNPGDAHGTSVAGVAAARGNNGEGVAGASYNSSAISIRMFDGSSVASDARIALALRYAAVHSDIVNNSWGGGGVSTAINTALDWGVVNGRGGRGTSYFFATGNDFSASISYPASQALVNNGVVAVGATNNRGTRSNYSNYGQGTDFVTPSNDTRSGYLAIQTTDRTGAAGYAAGDYTGTGSTGFGGTSSATPLATGIAALVLAQAENLNVNLNPAQLKSYLRNTTDLIGGVSYDIVSGFHPEYGQGRLNAFTAVSGVGKPEISVVDSLVEYQSSSAYGFGSLFVGQSVTKTFRIRNQGTEPLQLTSLTVPAPFSIVSNFADSSLGIGESTNITLAFAPVAGGSFNETAVISSNDANEGAFSIVLTGTATFADVAGNIYEDFARDSVKSPFDGGVDVGAFAYVDANDSGTFNAGETQAFIDATGAFYFGTLPIGTHIIRSNSTGWQLISPANNRYTVTIVDETSNFQGLEFGYQKNSRAYARVFNDRDLDGVLDAGELPESGLLIYTDTNSNQRFEPSYFQNSPVPVLDLETSVSTIVVPDSFTIQDLNVSIRITHTWMSDMIVTLVSPSGARVLLANQRGTSQDGYINTIFDDEATVAIGAGTFPYTGRYRPEQSLTAVDGTDARGTWRLEVFDVFGADEGVIEAWSLNFGGTEVGKRSNGDGFVGVDVPGGTTPLQLELSGTYEYTVPSNGVRNVTGSANPINGLLFGVINENFPPTNLFLSNSSVPENRPIGTTVGLLTTQDPNTRDVFTYSLVAGGVDNSRFSIAGNALQTGAIFDYETKNSYSIRVRSTDSGGLFTERDLVISVTDVNEAATRISLSNNVLPENEPAPRFIGTLSTDDPDAGDSVTFALVPGAGSADNSLFRIQGTALEAIVSLDFEARPIYRIRVRATDFAGLSIDQQFTIFATDVNESPQAIQISNTQILENQPAGTSIGDFTAIDPENNVIQYALVAGDGSEDNGRFTIVGQQLRSAEPFDFETVKRLAIRVRATDAGGLSIDRNFVIGTLNVNENPTLLELSSNTVDEFRPVGTIVGSFTTTDPDVGDRFTYSLFGTASFPDNLQFNIVGNEIRTASVFDFESKSQYVVQVRTTDLGGLSYSIPLTVRIRDVNDPPSDIGLSSNIVAENSPIGQVIGKFNTFDPDSGDTFVYTLATGTGSADNGSFSIVGDELRASATFNFEARSSYSIRVASVDSSGSRIEKVFAIRVTDAPEAPTTLTLTGDQFPENASPAYLIGSFSSVDPDAGDTLSYSLAVGSGDSDNGLFEVSAAGQLRTKLGAAFDFETKSSFTIRARVQDSAGLSREGAFTIRLTNVNEAPHSLDLSYSLSENMPAATQLGQLVALDPDTPDSLTFTLVTGTGSDDNGLFALTAAGQLRLLSPADFESKSSYSIRARATDAAGLWVERAFVLSVTDVPEAPLSVSLSPNILVENSEIGAVIGSLNSVDSDANESFTYSFVPGDGSVDNNQFAIVGTTVRSLFVPNFEVKEQYQIRIRSTDKDGLFVESPFVISVVDVNESPSTLALSGNLLPENSPALSLVGRFSALDPDRNDTLTFQFVSGSGDLSNSLFEIRGDELIAKDPFDFETAPVHTVRVAVRDAGGLQIEQSFTILIQDVNEAPTPPVLSTASIAENRPAGSVVGRLSSSDEDFNDPPRFELVSGFGDAAEFAVSNGELLAMNSFDFESKSSYVLAVRAMDRSGDGPTSTFTISVSDVNEAPTAIVLASNEVDENVSIPWSFGPLSHNDPDTSDVLTWSLASGSGDADNGRFEIVSGELRLITSPDFESQSQYLVRLRAEDLGGLFVEQSFVLGVRNVEELPVDLALSNVSLPESNATDRVVGVLSATDPDGLPIEFLLDSGFADASSFMIQGNELRLVTATDFESDENYTIGVIARDAAGNEIEQTYLISITDIEEAPTSIALSRASVPENFPIDAPIGVFSTVDSDRNESFTYSLLSAAQYGLYIVGDQLFAGANLDYESLASTSGAISLTVRATDSANLFVDQTITLQVLDINEAPTRIVLSHSETFENNAIPSEIGVLSTDDPDAFTVPTLYSLVPGDGSVDNARFEILGDRLLLIESTDFEQSRALQVRIRATDEQGAFVEQTFSIGVVNQNETPFNLQLSNTTLAEGPVVGRLVGLLSATEPDGSPLTYVLPVGEEDNEAFGIVGNQLRLIGEANFEVQSSYTVVVRAVDPEGLFTEATFAISITDVDEAPVGLSLSNGFIDENVAIGSVVGQFTTNDPDLGETFSYAILSIDGDASDTSFVIVGDELRTNSRMNFETQSGYLLRIQTTDSAGLQFDRLIRVELNDLVELPPQASNDSGRTAIGLMMVMSVLSNDMDPDGLIEPATVEIVGLPVRGTARVMSDGRIEYTPSINTQVGSVFTDSFTYRVRDNQDEWSNVATANITVDSAFYNRQNPFDVDADGSVSPLDVLVLVNEINVSGSRVLPRPVPFSAPYIDPTNDGVLDPLDVLQVVNYLNNLRDLGPGPEGESDATESSMGAESAADVDMIYSQWDDIGIAALSGAGETDVIRRLRGRR